MVEENKITIQSVKENKIFSDKFMWDFKRKIIGWEEKGHQIKLIMLHLFIQTLFQTDNCIILYFTL